MVRGCPDILLEDFSEFYIPISPNNKLPRTIPICSETWRSKDRGILLLGEQVTRYLESKMVEFGADMSLSHIQISNSGPRLALVVMMP